MAAANAGIQQANAAFWPQLQVQSSYTRTDNPMLVFGSILNQRAYSSSLNFNDVPDVDDFNARGMVTLPLYAGGRNKAAQSAARANSEAAKQDNQAVRNTLTFEVARAFHTLTKTYEFVRAAEAAVISSETNTSIAAKRLQGGSLLRTDLLDLEVRLAQVREDLVRARNANALASRALQNLLGIEEQDFAIVHEPNETSALSRDSLVVPTTADFSARPELRAAVQREQVAQAQVRSARAGYIPRLSAFGIVDYDYGTKYRSDGSSYAAGALIQWNAWDGNLTRGKVSEAEANLDGAHEEQRKVQLAISLEAEQARLGLKAAAERLGVTERAVQNATESAVLSRARFEQGQVLSTQLMDAETALLSTRVRRAEAEADRKIAMAALRKAYGLSQSDFETKTK